MPTREEILAAMKESASRLRTKTIAVPEWGKDVTVAQMSVERAREFSKLIERDGILASLAWAIAGMVDDTGAPMFTVNDVALFERVPSVAIRRISDAVIELNALDKTPEELEKNSEASQS